MNNDERTFTSKEEIKIVHKDLETSVTNFVIDMNLNYG